MHALRAALATAISLALRSRLLPLGWLLSAHQVKSSQVKSPPAHTSTLPSHRPREQHARLLSLLRSSPVRWLEMDQQLPFPLRPAPRLGVP